MDSTLTEWKNFNNNLPNVLINELEINTIDNKIYAATYGRGCWSSPLYKSTLSISENSSALQTIKVYPNPSNGTINLKWNIELPTSIRLYNIQGQLVYFSKDLVLKNKQSINTSRFGSGTYFLKMNNKKGTIIKKVVIK